MARLEVIGKETAERYDFVPPKLHVLGLMSV